MGTTSIVVRNESTGQVVAVPAAFTYTGMEEQDDGGGCAAVIPPPGPPKWRDVVGGMGWIFLAFFCATLRSVRSQSLRKRAAT